jgi:signal transduction protein with GAF and PtsI domain
MSSICYIIDIREIQIDQVETIKNRDILSIIREVSETLTLSSNPPQLLGASLDTISRIFKADCCWVQLANTGQVNLPLIASLGFTADMKREIDLIDRDHRFSHEIVGLGHKIIIPSLNRDGKYSIPIFKNSGFRSLLAVPIMTYRIHGILGMAFRSRMKFSEDFTQLYDVIANLIGMSLHKSTLNERQIQKRPVKPANSDEVKAGDEKTEEMKVEDSSAPDIQSISDTTGGDKDCVSEFHDHARCMRRFNKSHK